MHRFLGGNPRELPHPGVDYYAFRSKIKELLAAQPKVFCTVTNQMRPWVDIKQLDKLYGNEGSINGSKSCSVM